MSNHATSISLEKILKAYLLYNFKEKKQIESLTPIKYNNLTLTECLSVLKFMNEKIFNLATNRITPLSWKYLRRASRKRDDV